MVCIAAVVSMFMLGNGREVSAAGYGANCQNCEDQFRACTQKCDNSTVTANKSQCYNACNESYDRCMTLCKCTISCQDGFKSCMKEAETSSEKESCREDYMDCKKDCYKQLDEMESGQRSLGPPR